MLTEDELALFVHPPTQAVAVQFVASTAVDQCKVSTFATLKDEDCAGLETSKEILGRFALSLLNCNTPPTYRHQPLC